MGDRADAGIASLGVITLLTMTAALVVVAMQRGTFIYSVSNGASTRTLASLVESKLGLRRTSERDALCRNRRAWWRSYGQEGDRE